MSSTTSKGRHAEQAVAAYLVSLGHEVLCMNWRNRWCEIDVISKKNRCVYFTEVKYRMHDNWGGGFDYIGEKKLRQMKFAADYWMTTENWKEDAALCAAEVDATMKITFVEL